MNETERQAIIDFNDRQYCALGSIYQALVDGTPRAVPTRRQKLRRKVNSMREQIALWICPWLLDE